MSFSTGTAGRQWAKVVGGTSRLLDPLPLGFNLRARCLIREGHPYPQLPGQTRAPKYEQRIGLVGEFLHLRASPVRLDLQCLAGEICAAKYNRSGVDGAVGARRC